MDFLEIDYYCISCVQPVSMCWNEKILFLISNKIQCWRQLLILLNFCYHCVNDLWIVDYWLTICVYDRFQYQQLISYLLLFGEISQSSIFKQSYDGPKLAS